jgi:N-acetylglucosaminyldiphosphoundecaprenol N-acetyl-beta-D-mannosaminyltransferase
LHSVISAIQRRQRVLITHIHVMGLNIAYEQTWFRDFLNDSDLVYCDGMGVKLGARLLGSCVPERLTLADWYVSLAELARQNNFSLFLLGNPPGIAEQAADRLRQRFSGLPIAGVHHGFFCKDAGHAENEAVITMINAARPDILLVGFGMPAQERWLLENRPRLDVNVVITVGALFEYIAGDLARGPRWMTQNYLEWLARLLISPGRYWRRYLRDNPIFLARLLRQKISGSP